MQEALLLLSNQENGRSQELRAHQLLRCQPLRTFSLNPQDQALRGDKMSLKNLKDMVTVGERDAETSDTMTNWMSHDKGGKETK